MTKKKKLNAKQVSKHACAENAYVSVTVVGWCCSFYKKALEKRLLKLGLEIREVIDYSDEFNAEGCLDVHGSVLLLAGLSEFSPQLITANLRHIASKIPNSANVVFAGHESLHETISNLLNNVICCPPLFSDSFEIVDFEFEKHIVYSSDAMLKVNLNAEKLSNVPFDYPSILTGAVVVAEHSGICSLLTKGRVGIDQWQIQSVIGLNLFIEKFREVYSSDLKLIKIIAKLELDNFHEIMTTTLSSRPSSREIEVIYLAFITSLLTDKFETSGNCDKIKMAFAGSISQNFSREDLENIIEIVFESDSFVLLDAEFNSKDVLQKMER